MHLCRARQQRMLSSLASLRSESEPLYLTSPTVDTGDDEPLTGFEFGSDKPDVDDEGRPLYAHFIHILVALVLTAIPRRGASAGHADITYPPPSPAQLEVLKNFLQEPDETQNLCSQSRHHRGEPRCCSWESGAYRCRLMVVLVVGVGVLVRRRIWMQAAERMMVYT